jgi:ribosome biogenesis GTPase
MAPAELIAHYPDLAWVAQGCRFGNCAHIAEPGCAVRAAACEGRVSRMRYDSYRKIYESLGG